MDNWDLILKLDKLNTRMRKTNGISRTAGLYNRMGGSCGYAIKSMELFFRQDYEEIKNLIEEIHECIKE